MKPFSIIIVILFLLHKTMKGQEVKAYIKNLTANEFTLQEFNAQEIIQLTDSTKKVHSYMVVIAPDSSDYYAISISGNSLQNKDFQKLLDKYQHHFRLFFEDITYWVGLENSPDGYKKTKMAVCIIKIK